MVHTSSSVAPEFARDEPGTVPQKRHCDVQESKCADRFSNLFDTGASES